MKSQGIKIPSYFKMYYKNINVYLKFKLNYTFPMNERMECRGFVFLLYLLVANLQAAIICCGFPCY